MIKDCTPGMTTTFETISYRLCNNHHRCPVAVLLHISTATDAQRNVTSRHAISSGCQFAVHSKSWRHNVAHVCSQHHHTTIHLLCQTSKVVKQSPLEPATPCVLLKIPVQR